MKLVRQRYGTGFVAVFLLISGVRALHAQTAADFEGQRIVNIAFNPTMQPLEAAELFRILPVKRNEVYSATSIRAAIERLYATGRYQDIQVDAIPAAGGVALTFITKNSWFIGNVAATADFGEPPNVGQIVNASRLQLGDPFDIDQIPAAVENIRKLMVQNGFFEPRIAPQYQYDGIYQQVHVTFVVKTGKRARFEAPEISGDTSILNAAAITSATKWRRFLLPGYRGITQTRTGKGIDNVRLKYENSNRLLATVTLTQIEPQGEDARSGKPYITVNPGPTVEVTTPGTKVCTFAPGCMISKRQLHENVPIFEEHTVDDDLLARDVPGQR